MGNEANEFRCADNYWPLIPDGKYDAVCKKHSDKICFGKSRKVFLNFEIVSPKEYQGIELFMVFNMPFKGRVKKTSRFYKYWVMVNGWKLPSRNTKMSPRIFLNKLYEVETATVKPKHNGDETPAALHYSKVENILYVLTGKVDY